MQSTEPTWILASTAFQVLDIPHSHSDLSSACCLLSQLRPCTKQQSLCEAHKGCILQEEQRLSMTSFLAHDLLMSI